MKFLKSSFNSIRCLKFWGGFTLERWMFTQWNAGTPGTVRLLQMDGGWLWCLTSHGAWADSSSIHRMLMCGGMASQRSFVGDSDTNEVVGLSGSWSLVDTL